MKQPTRNDSTLRIPPALRTFITIKRDNIYRKVLADLGSKYGYEFTVAVYNDRNIKREPDKIGISFFYPSAKECTHVLTETFPIDIKTSELTLELKRMFKDLKGKVPKKLQNKKIKES